MYARVIDKDGGLSDYQTTLTVNNVAPTLGASGANACNEGSAYVLNLSASDPGADAITIWTIDWGDGQIETVANAATALHTYGDNGNYSISTSATDEDGTSVGPGKLVAVANVAPTSASISGPAALQTGDVGTFTLGATDPSSVDQNANSTFRIDWDGNGTIDETVLGLASTTVDHAFASAGNVTLKITATDKDAAESSPASFQLNVTIPPPPTVVMAQVVPDPLHPTGTMLVITGTSVTDDIRLKNLNSNPNVNNVEVKVNGVVLGIYYPTDRIVLYAGDGDDVISSAGKFKRPVELYGGAGDDKLRAGDSGDIVVGGMGDDTLVGGAGRDILIGGVRADKIVGDAGDDILIAGSTAYDADPTALNAILSEWTSSRPYASRVDNIMGISSNASVFSLRLNGNYFFRANLSDATIFDDGVRDTLTGDQGQDWFLFNNDAGITDHVADRNSSEIMTAIDF